MEHITITKLNDDIIRLIPDKGYKLYNTITKCYYSEAEVKDSQPYVAVKIESVDN